MKKVIHSWWDFFLLLPVKGLHDTLAYQPETFLLSWKVTVKSFTIQRDSALSISLHAVKKERTERKRGRMNE